MLKSIFQIVLCSLFLTSCNKKEQFVKTATIPSRIDSLTTNAEIEQYIGDCDSLYRKFTLQKVQDIVCSGCDTITNLDSLANSLHIDFSWQKADIDNNGYTDLSATGTNKTYGNWNFDPKQEVEYSKDFNAFVIMNFGNGKTKLYDLTDGRFMSITTRIEYEKDQAFVGIYTPRLMSKIERYKRKETKSLLTYKFGDFIEYNFVPKEYDIEKIEYTNGIGYTLKIEKNGDAFIIAKANNYTLPWEKGLMPAGYYKTLIREEDFARIIEILNYTDFPTLQNDYAVPWTCDATGSIKITYSNGKTKIINDYGKQGTFGLKLLHQRFGNLWTNQKWEKIN